MKNTTCHVSLCNVIVKHSLSLVKMIAYRAQRIDYNMQGDRFSPSILSIYLMLQCKCYDVNI